MEQSQTMNNTDRDFPSEENLNSNLQNEVKQISIKNGIKPIEKQLSSNKEVISLCDYVYHLLQFLFHFFIYIKKRKQFAHSLGIPFSGLGLSTHPNSLDKTKRQIEDFCCQQFKSI